MLHCELTGHLYEATRVLQDTNGYLLSVPIPYSEEHGDLAAPRRKRVVYSLRFRESRTFKASSI